VNEEKSSKAKIAIRSLTMTGTPEKNLAYWQKYQRVIAKQGDASILDRLKNMERIYQLNSTQVGDYDKFIHDVWDLGKSGDATAQQVLKSLLESSSLSQKLLSAFFYFNPHNGKTMMLFPTDYIASVVKQIQEMMLDPNRDDLQAFKTIVETFDQSEQIAFRCMVIDPKFVDNEVVLIGTLERSGGIRPSERCFA
jgi:hypothetical protein